MESEIRFYYPDSKYEELSNLLKSYGELNYEGCFHELTVQYDHPVEEQSFYNKEIDGRFRVRTSKEINTNYSKAKISWKKRSRETFEGIVNKEEEVELDFKYDELDNLTFLLEKVIKMKKVESYERYRNVFSNRDVEIVVDKYPFGIALEIENKSNEKSPEEAIMFWVNKLGLSVSNSYRLEFSLEYKQHFYNKEM